MTNNIYLTYDNLITEKYRKTAIFKEPTFYRFAQSKYEYQKVHTSRLRVYRNTHDPPLEAWCCSTTRLTLLSAFALTPITWPIQSQGERSGRSRMCFSRFIKESMCRFKLQFSFLIRICFSKKKKASVSIWTLRNVVQTAMDNLRRFLSRFVLFYFLVTKYIAFYSTFRFWWIPTF